MSNKMVAFLFSFLFVCGGTAAWMMFPRQPNASMVFIHGLFERNRNVERSANWYKKHLFANQTDINLLAFDFPEIEDGVLASPVGQGEDIDRLVAFRNEHPTLGMLSECRGSSALLFAMAREQWVLPFAILNAPLVSIRSFGHYQLRRYGRFVMIDMSPLVPGAANRIAKKLFRKHELNGQQPIDVVDQIPVGTPFLLIVSKDDTIVTPNDTRHLYLKLKKLGHTVYLLEADGEHCKGIKPKIDANCRRVVNAFLASVGAPHNKQLATEGEHLFAQCQPTEKEVKKHMKKDPKFCNKKFKTNKKGLLVTGGILTLGAAAHILTAGTIGTALFAGIIGHQLVLPLVLFMGGRIAHRIIREKGL